ncbi:MAG: succinate--CoA ligase subunit alpha [Thermoplasmata archaeon]|nr:succinate--CoA ligase subunit alpha [Thermoplasmata archaeon]
MIVPGDARVIVQGITGKQGRRHTKEMLEFGTKIVAGVTPGRGGERIEGIPVYDTVKEAMREKANASIIFVPANEAKNAVMEAIDSGIKYIVVITDGIPLHDSIEFIHYGICKNVRIIGPNCPGIAIPGKMKIGIFPNSIFKIGSIGVVSRSGTLTYEIVNSMSKNGMGQSMVIGIGGDAINGTTMIEVIEEFERDKGTEAIVIIGEIGGVAEEMAAEYIKKEVTKPVYAYIAGRFAPPNKKMGHAGAIVYGNMGSAVSKIKAFKKSGVKVAELPYKIVEMLKNDKEIW